MQKRFYTCIIFEKNCASTRVRRYGTAVPSFLVPVILGKFLALQTSKVLRSSLCFTPPLAFPRIKLLGPADRWRCPTHLGCAGSIRRERDLEDWPQLSRPSDALDGAIRIGAIRKARSQERPISPPRSVVWGHAPLPTPAYRVPEDSCSGGIQPTLR